MKERKGVHDHLRSSGIASAIYYPLPLHQLEPYRRLGFASGSFPEAEQTAQETLAIPLYPEMVNDQINGVASRVREALALVGSRPHGAI